VLVIDLTTNTLKITPRSVLSTVTGLTAGRPLFGGANGQIAQSARLRYDSATGFFGIGPTAPSKALILSGTTADQSTVLIQPTVTTQAAFYVTSNQASTNYYASDNSTGSQFGNGAYAVNLFASGNVPIAISNNGTLDILINRGGAVKVFDSLSVGRVPTSVLANTIPDTLLLLGPNGVITKAAYTRNDTLVKTSASIIGFDRGGRYVFTGTTTTATLKAGANTAVGTLYTCKNRGSGSVTVETTAAANEIYDTAATNTMTILAGGTLTLYWDGTFFNVENK